MDEGFMRVQAYWGLRSAIRQVSAIRDATINQLDDLFECVPCGNSKVAAAVAREIAALGKDIDYLVAALREVALAAAVPDPSAPDELEPPPSLRRGVDASGPKRNTQRGGEVTCRETPLASS
jgi:hypothetical protein